jgi:hypothetical protein
MSEAALHDQALAAAADVLAELVDVLPVELHGPVRAALAIAWIEGRQAGGQEAAAVVRTLLESLK